MVNTVNWLDGLNGLAAGVTAIACAVLFINAAFRLEPAADQRLAAAARIAGRVPGLFALEPFRRACSWDRRARGSWAIRWAAWPSSAGPRWRRSCSSWPCRSLTWPGSSSDARRRGVSVGAGGRDHLHFRLLDAGIPQWKIVAGYYAFCAAFGALALVTSSRLYKLVALVVLGILVLIVLWQTERHSR